MKLELVPLLKIQRELYDIPRGMVRFQQYLRVMTNERRDDLDLPPLGLMNPMGKDHVGPLLDSLLALDAEAEVDRAVTEASKELTEVPGDFKIGLVLADDAKGAWTNRYNTEFSLRFKTGPVSKQECRREYQNWLSGVLWTSEEPSMKAAVEAALMPIFRVAYVQQHGLARTLGEMLAQEGYVMAKAGCTTPNLDEDDLDYTRSVIAPHRDVHDRPTIFACLFGDTVARSLGYSPEGLSDWAGLALALHEHQLSECGSSALCLTTQDEIESSAAHSRQSDAAHCTSNRLKFFSPNCDQ